MGYPASILVVQKQSDSRMMRRAMSKTPVRGLWAIIILLYARVLLSWSLAAWFVGVLLSRWMLTPGNLILVDCVNIVFLNYIL